MVSPPRRARAAYALLSSLTFDVRYFHTRAQWFVEMKYVLSYFIIILYWNMHCVEIYCIHATFSQHINAKTMRQRKMVFFAAAIVWGTRELVQHNKILWENDKSFAITSIFALVFFSLFYSSSFYYYYYSVYSKVFCCTFRINFSHTNKTRVLRACEKRHKKRKQTNKHFYMSVCASEWWNHLNVNVIKQTHFIHIFKMKCGRFF